MTVTAPERPAYASDYQLPSRLDTWLDQVVTHYADAGVPLPDRQYWTIGQTAHDCEQVVLSVQQMFLGTAGAPIEVMQCHDPRSLTFTIEVVRCTPTVDSRGRVPSGALIESSSVDPVIDMEMLMDCAAYFDPDRTGVVVTVDVIPAQGGFHGALATYTVTLLP